MPSIAPKLIAACALFISAGGIFAAESAASACSASSGASVTPVVELYTSEGCSSCPPADKWASSLKSSGAVVQAFHVGYWDHIGWVDRFAAPAHTKRQREVAATNQLRGIYTPQVVLDGKDWPGWQGSKSNLAAKTSARINITLKQLGADQFEASIAPAAGATPLPWSAYWTVTENGHHSKVQAGENAGEWLKHDFVVRQYTQAGDYAGKDDKPQALALRSIAATPGYQRQVNLVVFDKKTGNTLQAVSLQCGG
jgi:hypothetical protein